MKRMIGVIVTSQRISMVFDGRPQTISADHPNFESLKDKILSKDYTDDDIETLIRPSAAVEREVKNSGGKISKFLTIDEYDIIRFKDETIPDVLQRKLLDHIAKGNEVKGFCLFIENLMQNPLRSAVDELYLFMESGNLPITKDGHFLAYKRVTANYTDCHTGTMDNSVGKTVSMPRELVDTDRHNTCSSGLHFCSYGYLASFGGAKTVVVKINPADVVSIPSDYRNTKGRTWKYEVVADVTDLGDCLSKATNEDLQKMLYTP